MSDHLPWVARGRAGTHGGKTEVRADERDDEFDTAGDDRAAWRPDDPIDESATAGARVDSNGIVTAWSEGARRLLGYRSTEVIGRPRHHCSQGSRPSRRFVP